LIAAFVSGPDACRLCYGAHVAGAEAFRATPGLVDSLIENLDGTAALDGRLKPVLQFVRKLTNELARVTQTDAEAVFADGLGASPVRTRPCPVIYGRAFRVSTRYFGRAFRVSSRAMRLTTSSRPPGSKTGSEQIRLPQAKAAACSSSGYSMSALSIGPSRLSHQSTRL
jgi:hypothetical protein